jgi:hypothetical protein
MRNSMKMWIEQGIIGGSFLKAVISNDLIEAYRRADRENKRCLGVYVEFLTYEAPSKCYGHPDVLDSWEGLKNALIKE